MHPLEKLHQRQKYNEFCDKIEKQTDVPYRLKVSIETLNYIMPLDIVYETKDSSKSDKFRKEADKILVQRSSNTLEKCLEAWELYSKSLAFAESESDELATIYANRSAVLCNLSKFTESIQDIDKAVKLTYPDKFKANLLRRKVKCLKLLGQKVDDTYEEVIQWLESTKLDDESKKKVEQQIQNAAKTTASFRAEKYDAKLLDTNFERNNKVPCASSAIDIKYDKNFGRCLVATRDIKVGEVLVVEKPYAALLRSDSLYTHCSHCFKRAWNAIPCEKCVYAMYCSENCRSEAWKQYHDVECPIKGYLLGMASYDPLASFSLKVALLAIRQAGSISELEKQLQSIAQEEEPLKKCFSEDGLYHSDQYRQIHSLESHENKCLPAEAIIMSFNAALILYYVHSFTSFLGDSPDKSIDALAENEDAIFLGKLLVNHYMALQINQHELTEADYEGKVKGIGSAVVSFCSLFNHNCNPNASRISAIGENNNLQLVIVAINPIQKDSQIFDDYGFDFTTKPYSERKDHCNEYYFTCMCKACVERWPCSRKDLPSVKNLSLRENEKIELMKTVSILYSFTSIYNTNDTKNLDRQSEKVLKDLVEAVTLLHKHNRSPPLREYYDAVIFFRQAFSAVHRNRYML